MLKRWLLVLLLLASPLLAADTQVNTFTTGAQNLPSVAIDVDGDFVVVWDSPQDGDGKGVFGKRFNSTGTAVAAEFQVNTHTPTEQYYANAASEDNGDFVVTWTSKEGQDGDGYGVFGQLFSSAGVRLSTEFQINTYATGYQADAFAAMDPDGDFIVTWAADTNLGDANGYAVLAKRYNNSGVAVGVEFQVNTYVTGHQDHSAVTVLTDGGFVIAWQSPQDGSTQGIFAQRFNSSGVAVSGEFQVNTATAGQQSNVSLDALPNGGFVISWTGVDAYYAGVIARRFNSSGVGLATEFLVNDYETGTQYRPQIATDASGAFIIAWTSGVADQDGDSYGVFAKRFNSSGTAIATEFQVPAFTTGEQERPAVAVSDDGSYVVAWRSPQDGNSTGIFMNFSINPTPTVAPAVTAEPATIWRGQPH